MDTLNDEEQLYVDTNQQGQPMHSVSNGTLKLHASLMTDPVADTVIEQRVFKYESAMLRSKRLFRPNKKRSYYITARVRLPNVRGTLPQFWLAPSIGRDDFVSQWPPEIDIMEAPINGRGAETEYTIWQSTVLGQEGGVLPGPQTDSGLHEFTYKLNAFQPDASVQDEYCCWQTTAESLRETWIEVGTEWTTDEVCFYLNGVKFSCENYKWRHQIDSEKSVLANKAHLLMNFAIGGAWAGRHGVDDQAFPTAMEVDYIRVYKRNESKRSKRGYRQR